MSIETFTAAEFEQVLKENALNGYEALGFVQDELTYRLWSSEQQWAIQVRSSIHSDGQSADSGKDSIRLWLVSQDGSPLGKIDAYTQRTAGWQSRLSTKIQQLIELRSLAGDCKVCQQPLACFVTQQGKNEGRVFAKCTNRQCSACNQWVKWVETSAHKQEKKDARAELKIAQTQKRSLSDALDKSENNTHATPIFDAVLKTAAPVANLHTQTASPQQEAIALAAVNTQDNLRIDALAGTGKTTSNVYLSKKLDPNLRVKAMAFNKRNADDMASKFPPNVKSSTAHSAAFADVRRVTPRVVINGEGNRKSWNLFNQDMRSLIDDEKEITAQEIQSVASDVITLVSLCKNNLLSPTDENLQALADHQGILLGNVTLDAFASARRIYYKSLEISNVEIDFDDMVFLPALGRVEIENEPTRVYNVAKSDLLLVDEAQDTNPMQQAYYLKAAERIIFVGDKHQAIYGFRGSDVDAMQHLSVKLNATGYPLSVCYRCPKSVIVEAQKLVPEIEWAPNAIDGAVSSMHEEQLLHVVKPGTDMVLCRLNAPLVKPVFELIRNGVKATILGRDIGKGLVTLVKKIQRRYGVDGAELTLVLRKMLDYGAEETVRLRTMRKESLADMLEDQINTIMALCDGAQTVRDFETNVNNVFSDTVQGVPFSTVHKAKGMQSKNVFILRPDLMPFNRAKLAWQLVQEQNIKYVAITRAQEHLYWVHGE